MSERARRAELVVQEQAESDTDDGGGGDCDDEDSAHPRQTSSRRRATSVHQIPTTTSKPTGRSSVSKDAVRNEASIDQVSLGRRSGTTAFLAGSRSSYAATSTAIVKGIDAGTHMIPAASCWSASAERPPGRWASAA